MGGWDHLRARLKGEEGAWRSTCSATAPIDPHAAPFALAQLAGGAALEDGVTGA
jgi:hypothetical protein